MSSFDSDKLLTIMEQQNVHNLKWRLAARAVSWIDLVLNVSGWIVLIVILILGEMKLFIEEVGQSIDLKMLLRPYHYQLTKDHDHSSAPHGSKILYEVYSFWLFAIGIIGFSLYFWGVVKLMKATSKERSMKEALQMCNVWINCNIIYIFILMLVPTFVTCGLYIALGYLFIRGVFTFIVCRFMSELKLRSSTSTLNLLLDA